LEVQRRVVRGEPLGCLDWPRVLFSNRSRIPLRACRAHPFRTLRFLLTSGLPLQHSFAARRLATFGALVTVSCALACYQDKPPQSAGGAPAASSASRSSDSGAQLGLQPVPATHDTSIREIDTFRLTSERLQKWTAAKHALDSLHSSHPEVEAHIRAGGRPKNIDEAGKRFDDEPAMHGALQHAGTNGKDFLLTSIALQQAMKGFQLKAMGKLDASKVPPVVLENISFVSTHIKDIMGSIEAGASRRQTP
jgi:hypothetical protein